MSDAQRQNMKHDVETARPIIVGILAFCIYLRSKSGSPAGWETYYDVASDFFTRFLQEFDQP